MSHKIYNTTADSGTKAAKSRLQILRADSSLIGEVSEILAVSLSFLWVSLLPKKKITRASTAKGVFYIQSLTIQFSFFFFLFSPLFNNFESGLSRQMSPESKLQSSNFDEMTNPAALESFSDPFEHLQRRILIAFWDVSNLKDSNDSYSSSRISIRRGGLKCSKVPIMYFKALSTLFGELNHSHFRLCSKN